MVLRLPFTDVGLLSNSELAWPVLVKKTYKETYLSK